MTNKMAGMDKRRAQVLEARLSSLLHQKQETMLVQGAELERHQPRQQSKLKSRFSFWGNRWCFCNKKLRRRVWSSRNTENRLMDYMRCSRKSMFHMSLRRSNWETVYKTHWILKSKWSLKMTNSRKEKKNRKRIIQRHKTSYLYFKRKMKSCRRRSKIWAKRIPGSYKKAAINQTANKLNSLPQR